MKDLELHNKQKKEALVRMSMLKILSQVRKDFEKKDVIYYSERQNKIFNAVLYTIGNDSEYMPIIKDFEDRYNALVYHCQLTHTCYGDMLSIFYVSDSEEEWERDREDLKENLAFVRVENLQDRCFSEFGTIGVMGSMGGVLRTA